MKGSLATPRRAASSAATPRTTWPSSAYMRVWWEAHSACAARSGAPAHRRPHSVVQRRRFSHLVPQLIARPQGRPKLARGRRGLRGKGKVVSPQGFVRIHLRMQSHLQELPLLALDGQKVLGIPFEAAARQFGAAMHRGVGTAVSIHRVAPSLCRQLHILQLHAAPRVPRAASRRGAPCWRFRSLPLRISFPTSYVRE